MDVDFCVLTLAALLLAAAALLTLVELVAMLALLTVGTAFALVVRLVVAAADTLVAVVAVAAALLEGPRATHAAWPTEAKSAPAASDSICLDATILN